MTASRSVFQNRLILCGFAAAMTTVVLIFFTYPSHPGALELEINEPHTAITVLNGKGAVEFACRSEQSNLRIAVVPGNHRLVVEKAGFATFEMDFSIAAAEIMHIQAVVTSNAVESELETESPESPIPIDAVDITEILRPVAPMQAPATQFIPEATVAVQTPAIPHEHSRERAAIPSADRQKLVRTRAVEAVGLSKATSAPKKQQAIRGLLKIANSQFTSSDERYVTLQIALELGRDVGDIDLYREAIRKLINSFQVDATAEEAIQLAEFMAACKSAAILDHAAKDLVVLIEKRGRENQFRDAQRWLDSAQASAKRLNAKSVQTVVDTTRSALIERERAFESYQKSLQTLKSEPDEPKANFQIGRWLAAFEGNWSEALPRLAKGSDVQWQSAARIELGATTVDSKLLAADEWWELAKISTGTAKTSVQLHTLALLTELEPQVVSPLFKAQISKRKAELEAIFKIKSLAASDLQSQIPGGQSKTTKHDESELPIGEWIDLLGMVRLPEHVVAGNWKRSNGSLVCEPSNFPRFFVPVVVTGSYEVNCKFTRRSNKLPIQLCIPVGVTACQTCVDGRDGTVAGLFMIDGKNLRDYVGSPAAVLQKEPTANGVPHDFRVTVTTNGSEVRINTEVDRIQLITWAGQVSQLSEGPNHSRPNSHTIGLSSNRSHVDVHELKLRIAKGGRGYQLTDDWKNPLFEVAAIPPAEIADKCTDFKGKKYFISDESMSLPDAQHLAAKLKGRLLTISSAEEDELIIQAGRERTMWVSGWCAPDRTWRDERNRPLRYVRFRTGQPDNGGGEESQLEFLTRDGGGLNDINMGIGRNHVCIEWGEEYPDPT